MRKIGGRFGGIFLHIFDQKVSLFASKSLDFIEFPAIKTDS